MWKVKQGRLVKTNNILLDPLPESWESSSGEVYELDTDFRIGIQICLIQDDPELNAGEKSQKILELLFFDKIPSNPQELYDCIQFFISGWSHDKPSPKTEHKRLMDFDVDQWRIYSAFLQYYRIDLNEVEYMHWWTFMGLLSCLPECAYTKVIDIRNKKINPKMDKDTKKALEKAKEIYALEEVMSPEEKKISENLYDFLGGTQGEEEKKRVETFEKFAE